MVTVRFLERGGWLLDTQSMDQMGSPYLLAHGLGKPVEDAVLRNVRMFECLNGRKQVRVWVRTRDWVSPQGPGRFVVKIGDWTSKELGIGSGEWHWEDCGLVDLPDGEVEIRLHDLTGFDGRCAGIALTEPDQPAPNEDALFGGCGTMGTSRPVETYDFVVVGGGYAGMCAAVAAARKGVKVALVQDRPVWGGNASSEVRVGPIGGLGLKPFPANSDLAYELKELTHVDGERTSGGLRPIVDNAKLDEWLKAEKNLTTFACTKMVEARTECLECAHRRITSIVCQCWRTGERIELAAQHFADCTGDGTLAVLAGAEYREQPETKNETGEELATEGSSKGGYGSTNFWTTRWTDRETTFPSCPWALQIDETNWQVNRPKFSVEGDLPYAAGWNWESGFDRNPFTDAEQIRDYNLRAAYGMWDYLKNKSPDRDKYAKAEMDWLGFVLGKRAARRIVGDYVLCEQDLTQHREQPDGVVTTTWFLDLHFPHPTNAAAFPEGAFRSMAYDDPMYAQLAPQGNGRQIGIAPYAIPFRCFYSRNVENLWMAGKDISCTHVAMSSVRVENTTAQMGAMVGRAVSVCVKNGWSPRQLGEGHFGELAGILKRPGKLTRLAKRGQGRIGVKGEVMYWLRVGYHKFKKLVGTSYLEELAG